ncbi:hypothetical protein [Haliscomenobacter hydrossis]|uniref:Uncharacterized protein n=1 Tax=Haliscomenobacter hydrossis (strain ATCC 27775 / DSM 1100 / LMG 10767 / O) TaxID=760192 RepID=F4L5C4_HALH1|nr:hypothetical protein [Haliscomenobacter hydrossis]AEE49804.1 hypothetical protein Halhy_1919 [Haliscomenobacter hydrossis DSM 1100]
MLTSNSPTFPQRNVLRIAKNICILFSLLLLTSCYSVQIASKDSTGEPDPINMAEGPYKQLKVDTINKVIKISPVEKGFIMYVDCAKEGLYSVEYKVTLGGLLLSAITFGRHRKVKVKYVCAQEEN